MRFTDKAYSVIMADSTQSIFDITKSFTSQLFDSLSDFHATVESATTTNDANLIVIEILAANIGHLIGQIPKSDQDSYIKIVMSAIEEQIADAAMFDLVTVPGIVGHA